MIEVDHRETIAESDTLAFSLERVVLRCGRTYVCAYEASPIGDAINDPTHMSDLFDTWLAFAKQGEPGFSSWTL